MIGYTNMTEQQRETKRNRLVKYYFDKQQYKDYDAARRQVVNMDDVRLVEDYNRVFGT